MFKILIAAGIGGTLPTLCRLAAAYNVGANPPFGLGVYIAIGLFFIIGVAVAFGFGESDLKKAFVLGIAAPAIVTSTFNAATQGRSGTLAASLPQATRLGDVHAGSVARLFGIGDASAQPASSTPTSSSPVQAQLHVTSNVSSSSGYPIDPVELRFLSATGAVLDTTAVDPRVASTVTVPAGTRSVVTTIDGRSTTTQLPPTSFTSANFRLNLDTSHVSDFLWALGANRRVRVEGVSASLDGVQRAQAPDESASTRAARAEPVTLSAGTRVYSESGVPLGVVESVKPAAGQSAAQILIRADNSARPAR
jgi:hypothetical protein